MEKRKHQQQHHDNFIIYSVCVVFGVLLVVGILVLLSITKRTKERTGSDHSRIYSNYPAFI